MDFSRESVSRFMSRDRTAARLIVVGSVALMAAAILGFKVRRTAAPIKADRTRLETLAQQIQQFKIGFRPATNEEMLRWTTSADSLSLAIPHSLRLLLAEMLTQEAERAGLKDVRVRFVKPDTGVAAPPRTSPSGTPIPVAGYAVAVEFGGGFANTLTFVNKLPSTVFIERLGGVRTLAGTRYRLTLAVYEIPDDPTSG